MRTVSVVLFLCLAAIFLAVPTHAEVLHLNEAELLTKIKANDETLFVKFFAPWCGHCKNLAPTWKKLSEDESIGARIASVDCTQHRDACTKFNIKGFPTLILIKDNRMQAYRGARDIPSFKEFINTAAFPDELPKVVQEALSKPIAAPKEGFEIPPAVQDAVNTAKQVAAGIQSDVFAAINANKNGAYALAATAAAAGLLIGLIVGRLTARTAASGADKVKRT